MFLTKNFANIILDVIQDSPLTDGEIHRLEGFGKKYIALKSTCVDEKLYTELARLEVKGVCVIVYDRVIPDSL